MPDDRTSIPVTISKVADEGLVFGWANVTTKADTLVVDSHDEAIPTEDLEKAVYDFVPTFTAAAAGVGHEGKPVAHLVESLILTKEKAAAMGLEVDREGWWIGIRVQDPEVFARVKSGELGMFSIQGMAQPEELDD